MVTKSVHSGARRLRWPPILWSANTWLAYSIGEQYYGGSHFVWCSIVSGRELSKLGYLASPVSSLPWSICQALHQAIESGDRHASILKQKRKGILLGIEKRYAAGVIDTPTRERLRKAVNSAQPKDFRPLMYAIASDRVSARIREADVMTKAHPLSSELLIEDLQGDEFQVQEWFA